MSVHAAGDVQMLVGVALSSWGSRLPSLTKTLFFSQNLTLIRSHSIEGAFALDCVPFFPVQKRLDDLVVRSEESLVTAKSTCN